MPPKKKAKAPPRPAPKAALVPVKTAADYLATANLQKFITSLPLPQLTARKDDITDRLAELKAGITGGINDITGETAESAIVTRIQQAFKVNKAPDTADPYHIPDPYNITLTLPDLSTIPDLTTQPHHPAHPPPTDTPPASPAPPLPIPPTKEAHWDYLLKELSWLATDFAAESARHKTLARRISHSILHYHATLASRTEKRITDDLAKRKSTAKAIGRKVLSFWSKIETVVTFKQKSVLDSNRSKDMDRHLVWLVRQTERYGKVIGKEGEDGTVEECLRTTEFVKRGSRVDYKRLQVAGNDELYGHSTADEHFTDSGSDDGSYQPILDRDDETTLIEEEETFGVEDFEEEAKGLKEDMERSAMEIVREMEERYVGASEASISHLLALALLPLVSVLALISFRANASPCQSTLSKAH